MPVIHGSFHSFAHSSEHGVHYDDPSHSSETKPGGGGEGGHIPVKVTPEQNPFTSAASGLPTDSTPKKSMLQKVTSPTKQGDYVVDTKAPADANGSRPVYRRENDDIGTLKPTQERAIPDGKGGWKMVSDADAAKPAGAPALPPAAKIDPKQLGPLNDKGVYPGGDGNSYVRIGDDHYQVSYDKQWQGWKAVDPNRPSDLSKGVPVKLDGKGSAQALPKPGLKGGMDDGQRPGPSQSSKGGGLDSVVAKLRAQGEIKLRDAARQSKLRYEKASQTAENANLERQQSYDQYKKTKDNFSSVEKEQDQLIAMRNNESDPSKKAEFQKKVKNITNKKSVINNKLKEYHQDYISKGRKLNSAAKAMDDAYNDYFKDRQSYLDTYQSNKQQGIASTNPDEFPRPEKNIILWILVYE